MKKIKVKDQQLRNYLEEINKKHFVLKSIYKNKNLFSLIRWKAFLRLRSLSSKGSFSAISNRCILTINRKRFNKLFLFSRHTTLKFIRAGKFNGMKKSSW